MLLEFVRIGILLAIALAYALFDVFNKRNVPDLFAYISLAIGIAITFTYPKSIIVLSTLLAIAIGAISYVLYKIGQLGAGDGFEFVTISLILPIQGNALLVSANQYGLPFILSVFVASGIIAIWVSMVYYLMLRNRKGLKASTNDLAKGAIIFIVYMAMLFLFIYIFGYHIASVIIMLLIAIPSAVIVAFAKQINEGMVEWIYPSSLEVGDMIAVNMMASKELEFFKAKSKHFGRLATKEMVKEIKNVKKKLPVYKKALPLAAIVLFGILVSFLFGDVILLMV